MTIINDIPCAFWQFHLIINQTGVHIHYTFKIFKANILHASNICEINLSVRALIQTRYRHKYKSKFIWISSVVHMHGHCIAACNENLEFERNSTDYKHIVGDKIFSESMMTHIAKDVSVNRSKQVKLNNTPFIIFTCFYYRINKLCICNLYRYTRIERGITKRYTPLTLSK